MTNLIELRTRRFNALRALLTGEFGSVHLRHRELPDHLSRDLGFLEGRPHECPVSHLGIYIRLNRS